MSRIPRVRETGQMVTNSVAGATNEGFRFTAFAVVGDQFEMEVAWPATNLADYAAVDVFYKRNLDDPSWRWIWRENISDASSLTNSFCVSSHRLPFREQKVTRRFYEYTNTVAAPFGVEYSNVVSRVPVATEPAAGFFLAGNQHDADGDELPDMVETSLGLDPADSDTDQDGITDGCELLAGTNPLATDTDGDGLPDSFEMSWGRFDTNGLARWIDVSASTNRVVLFTNADNDFVRIPVPISFFLFGNALTNLAVNANGLVGWSTSFSAFTSGEFFESPAYCIPVADDPSATVAAFWDDLLVLPSMGSSVSVATLGTDGERTAVVEFSRMGFVQGGTNDFVSFQVQFSERGTNTVRVVVSEASGLGTGSSASLGARSSRDDGIEYSWHEPDAVFPGLVLEYHFGIGSDPSKTDTDGDGLADGAEFHLGTNPSLFDTDCDGLSDSFELAIGTDPLFSDTDGDLLSDGWEIQNGTNPLDSSDGASDMDRDGLTLAEEVLLHQTDPSCWDTDADGLSDGDEIVLGLLPRHRDFDEDGLPDGLEVWIGTDPDCTDSDSDGLSDKWEFDHAPFDPLDPSDGTADTDGDGLSNQNEIDRGTDWRNPDTDGDGLSDSEELLHDTDPLKADSDDDVLTDMEELMIGTNPHDSHSDGDGCPDGWEVLYGFDPLSVSSPALSADPDEDNLTNGKEGNLGTNPFSPDTDGDGLSDGMEVGWVDRDFAVLYDLEDATDFLGDLSDPENGAAVCSLPFPIVIQGAWTCTNLIICTNGYVNLSSRQDAAPSPLDNPTNHLAVLAFVDDLKPFPDELGSSLRAAEIVTNGIRHFVVEFRSFGFTGLDADPTNSVSFQIDFAENATNEVRVSFFRVDDNPNAPSLSPRALGSNATMGAATPRTMFLSFCESLAVPGRSIVYQLGMATDPLLEDSDDDGLSDFGEVVAGTDPLEWDTDGDSFSDAQEIAAGTDPHRPNSGNESIGADPDGDGLANAMEAVLGTNWHLADTDGDGVSDGVEWRQGSDPCDPADFAPRAVAETLLRFGDDSISFSEQYEVKLVPVSGDALGPFTFRNRDFGEVRKETLYFPTNAVYEVSLRHLASTESDPNSDLDYVLEWSVTNHLSGLATLAIDPDGLMGNHANVKPDQFDKTARIAIVPARILADRNRDGVIDEFDNVPGPLRQWLNDDKDDGSIAREGSDVPERDGMDETGNAGTGTVDGTSDLEDFFPVWFDLSAAASALRSFRTNVCVGVRLRCEDADVNVIPTSLLRGHAGDHLFDVATAETFATSTVLRVGAVDAGFSRPYLSDVLGNPDKGVLLLEGAAAGTNAFLHVELLADGGPALRVSLPLSISPVEDFYRWVNLRAATGGEETRTNALSCPVGFPDSESNGKDVVFVHGCNVPEREARGWSAEVFKRLWQAGSAARFHAVAWTGDEGFPNGLFRNENVGNALLTAPAFASVFSTNATNTVVFAHGLGNMVVCSAVQDHGFRPAVLCMIDSSVPAEAVDTNVWSDAETGNPMVHHDWKDYANRTWAAKWHELFSVDDDRSKLTWKGRFGSLVATSGLTLRNYLSSGDEVLGLYGTVGTNGMVFLDWNTGPETRAYAWQKRERSKGRATFDGAEGLAVTNQAGWGFKQHLEEPPGLPPHWVRDTYFNASDANAATTNQLAATPVFANHPPEMFSPVIPQAVRDGLLAEAIPALSPPIGAVAVLSGLSSVTNCDLNAWTNRNAQQEWPRPAESMYGTDFLHDDIKDIALPYVFGVWRDLKSCTEP